MKVFLTFSKFVAATLAAYFPSYHHQFTKWSFIFSSLFEVATLEDALLPHISIDILQGRKVYFPNGFRNET